MSHGTELGVAGSVLAGLLSAGPVMAQLAVQDMPQLAPVPAPYAKLDLGNDASCSIVVSDPPRRMDGLFVNMLLDLGPPSPGAPVRANMPKMGTVVKGWRDGASPEQNVELARPACESFRRRYELMTGAN